MDIFYSTHITPTHCTLNDDEAIHCCKVLRHKVGDSIQIIDGKGGVYLTEIENISNKTVICRITQKTIQSNQNPYFIRLVIAPTKNIDRYEFCIEKVVEIGVNEIIPVYTENSERKIVKKERTERVILAACKQSKKSFIPTIHEISDFSSVLQTPFNGIKCIAHCEETDKKYIHQLPDFTEITIAIGPEGDFSNKEILLAKSNGWEAITLGNSRLRTETAGIVAVVHAINKLASSK